MIDGEFLNNLDELIQPKILTVGDKSYSTEALHNLPLPNEPAFPSLEMATLDSLVDYVKSNRDKMAMESAQIACTAQAVGILTPPMGENRKRDILAKATCGRRALKLETYLDLESFRLQLLTQYSETPDQKAILSFISKVTDSNVLTTEDSGITQTVTARTGVASFGLVEIPSPVLLAPIRTFEEIEQPEGSFVFRMRKSDKGGLPEAGLFEIDTNWQRKAALSVAEYLKAKLPDMTILA